jgi:tetratricopeptide (TPR) repeat protein
MNDWHDAEGHIERAHELFEDGRWAEAERELRQALSLNPYKPEWHFNLGLTLEAAGRFQEALSAFRDCHQLDADDPQCVLLLGVNSLRTGDLRAAIGWLEKAQKLEPNSADSFVHRIEAYARLGDHEQAEVMFYMAQQHDPHNAGAYANLAESLLARGKHDKAVWCLREASSHDPHLPRVHARLAEAYAATGRLERARQLLLKELRNDPGDIDVLLDLGCLLTDMNRLGESGEKFRRILEIEPDNAEAHFFLADLSERQSQIDAALEGFGVVLRLDTGFPNARRRLAALLLSRRRGDDATAARQLLNEEVAILRDWVADRSGPQPFNDSDLDELGQTLLDAQMPAEARDVLTVLAGRRPDSVDALHGISVAHFQLGDREGGSDWARRVLDHNDKFVPAMHNLAVAAAQERRWSDAGLWVRRALKVDPDDAALKRLRVKVALQSAGDRVRKVWRRRPPRP